MKSWLDLMQNPKGVALKKFMVQALDEKVLNYDELLVRISTSLTTDNDMKLFAEMVNDLLAAGYKKAVEDYRDELTKMGISVAYKEPKRN